MDKPPIEILLVEDEPTDALLIEEALAQGNSTAFKITVAHRLGEAFMRLIERPFNVVLLDLGLPDCQGLETYERVRRIAPNVAVVVLSGRMDENVATLAVQAGAQDYLLKGEVGWTLLARAIRYAIERQQAQLALQASENRFRALIENSADAIVLMTANGVVTYASPAVNRILGYTPEEAVGRNAFEFVCPDDLTMATELFSQVLQHTQMPIHGQFRARHKDGSWHWVEAIGNNLLDAPNVDALILNFHDTTEQRQAEEQIRFQASLLQNVSDAIIATDLNFNITSWNNGAERLYGWTQEEVLGKRIEDLFETHYRSSTTETALQQLRAEGVWKGEAFQTSKDGRQIAVLASVSMIKDSSGNPIGVVAVNREVPFLPEAMQSALADSFTTGAGNGQV